MHSTSPSSQWCVPRWMHGLANTARERRLRRLLQMTIGYGSQFLQPECTSLVMLIAVQSVIGTVLDAVAIGFMYDRLSAARVRGDTIIFCDKAVLKPLGIDPDAGVAHFAFLFRFVESRSHQLTEAHVRTFAVRHEVAPPVGVTQAGMLAAKRRLLTLTRLLEGEEPLEAVEVVLPDTGHGPQVALRRREPVALAPISAAITCDAMPGVQEAGSHAAPTSVMYFNSLPMRLCRPTDEFSAMSLPLFPQEAAHRFAVAFTLPSGGTVPPPLPHPLAFRVDAKPYTTEEVPFPYVEVHGSVVVDDDMDGHMLFSPLSPTAAMLGCWTAMRGKGVGKTGTGRPPTAVQWRQTDGRALPDAAPPPPVPGSVALPPAGGGGAADAQQPPSPPSELNPYQRWVITQAVRQTVMRSWRESSTEIVALVEGIDEITSDTCQARHSYRASDIVWNGVWAPCVQPAEDGSAAIIDYKAFHTVLKQEEPFALRA